MVARKIKTFSCHYDGHISLRSQRDTLMLFFNRNATEIDTKAIILI